MPYSNPQDRIRQSKIYYENNKDKIKLYIKGWVKENPEKVKEYAKKKNKSRSLRGLDKQRYMNNGHIIRENAKRWRKNYPEKDKNNTLKKKYGITLEFFNEQLILQENKCKCCDVSFTDDLKPNVDHCHETGKFRSILCKPCNLMEGILRKKKDLITKVTKYMESYGKR